MAEAARVTDKLRLLVAELPFAVLGQVTVSFGVGQLGAKETLDAWIKRVDDVLYAAKAGGAIACVWDNPSGGTCPCRVGWGEMVSTAT